MISTCDPIILISSLLLYVLLLMGRLLLLVMGRLFLHVAFNSQTSMNATWSIMVAAYTSATIYLEIIAALVMTDLIWHMMDITV